MAALLCVAFLPVACGGDGDELRIYSSGEGDDLRAYQLALRDEGSDVGSYKLKLVALPSGVRQVGAPTKESLQRNARRAAADGRAIAYLGDENSGNTVFSMPITNRAGLLQICASCSYVGLTREEGALPGDPERLYPTGRRHFLRIAPNDHVQAAALVEYVRRENVDRIAILHDGQEYGKGLASLVAAAAPRAGVTLTAPPHVPSGDIRAEARRAAARGAEALMALTSPYVDKVTLVKRAAEAVPKLLIFAPGSFTNDLVVRDLKDVGDQFRITGSPQPDPTNAPAAKFVDRFTATYGSRPSPPTFFAYEAMRRVIQAARAAGERADERAAVISAVFAAKEEDTVVGRYRFVRTGDSTLTRAGAYRIKSGKLSYVDALGAGSGGRERGGS